MDHGSIPCGSTSPGNQAKPNKIKPFSYALTNSTGGNEVQPEAENCKQVKHFVQIVCKSRAASVAADKVI